MIFVIVGTQRFPFLRLFEWIDQAIEKGLIQEEVVAQCGYTEYRAKHFRTVPFFSQAEVDELVVQSSYVIAHAGVGTITNCLERGRPVLVVPRLKELEEHVDDHQLEISKVFQDWGYVAVARTQNDFEHFVPRMSEMLFKPYVRQPSDLLETIRNFVNSL